MILYNSQQFAERLLISKQAFYDRFKRSQLPGSLKLIPDPYLYAQGGKRAPMWQEEAVWQVLDREWMYFEHKNDNDSIVVPAKIHQSIDSKMAAEIKQQSYEWISIQDLQQLQQVSHGVIVIKGFGVLTEARYEEFDRFLKYVVNQQ